MGRNQSHIRLFSIKVTNAVWYTPSRSHWPCIDAKCLEAWYNCLLYGQKITWLFLREEKTGKSLCFYFSVVHCEKSPSPCFLGDYWKLCKLLGDWLESLPPFLEYQFVDSHFFSLCNITSIVIPEDIFCRFFMHVNCFCHVLLQNNRYYRQNTFLVS